MGDLEAAVELSGVVILGSISVEVIDAVKLRHYSNKRVI
jgi:hypothetical protein